MTSFKYKAISHSGAQIEGVIEAFDRVEAVNLIKETCSIVLSVQEVRGLTKETKNLFARVSEKSLSLICRQFAIILAAGLPLVKTVELVADQVSDKLMKKILGQVAGDIASGRSLAASFETRGQKKLPTTFIETIRAGEEAGSLDQAFQRLADYYNKRSKTRQKIKSAMIYPIFVIIVAVIVVSVVMMVAVPMFRSTFANMGINLPPLTRAMIAVSNFFSHYSIVLVIALAGLVIGVKMWSTTEQGRRFFGNLMLKLPVIGKVASMNAASQFANTMSTMMGAGLGIIKAIGITGKSVSNYIVGSEVQGTARGVETGRRLGACMKECRHLPDLLIEMTAVGEETGSLEDTLQVIGDYYDNEAEVAVTRALNLLEPAIIVMLAIFVVLILFAVYIPIFSMYNGIA